MGPEYQNLGYGQWPHIDLLKKQKNVTSKSYNSKMDNLYIYVYPNIMMQVDYNLDLSCMKGLWPACLNVR